MFFVEFYHAFLESSNLYSNQQLEIHIPDIHFIQLVKEYFVAFHS